MSPPLAPSCPWGMFIDIHGVPLASRQLHGGWVDWRQRNTPSAQRTISLCSGAANASLCSFGQKTCLLLLEPSLAAFLKWVSFQIGGLLRPLSL